MDYPKHIFFALSLCLCMRNGESNIYILEDAIYRNSQELSGNRYKRQTHPASTFAKFSGADDVFGPLVGHVRPPLDQGEQRSDFNGNLTPNLADSVDLTQPQGPPNGLVDYLTPPSPNVQTPAFNPTSHTLNPAPLPPPFAPTTTPDFSNLFGSASHFSSSFQAPAPNHGPQSRDLNGIHIDQPFQPTLLNEGGKWDLGYDASEILNPPVENSAPSRHLEDSLGPPPNFRRPSSLPASNPTFAASQNAPVSFSNHNQFADYNQGHNNFPTTSPFGPPPQSPHHAPHSDIVWGVPKSNGIPQPSNPFTSGLEPPGFRQQPVNSFNNNLGPKNLGSLGAASQATFTTKAPPPFSQFDSFVPQGSVRDNGFLIPPSDFGTPPQHTKRQSESLVPPYKFFGSPGTRSFQKKRQSVDGLGGKRWAYKRRSDDEDADSEETEGGAQIHAPVFSYVKTDKNGHFKWGVRQGLPSAFTAK
ncbi:unnamed protein product [Bemisia tabaci]|uniref:Uncharacterized protein n=1 Tax=Bemisia tabaci TaxID=7038 RepID=A0A9P0CBF6_BEMTA|nr:unnamed protein product [Bemisia tabaci]